MKRYNKKTIFRNITNLPKEKSKMDYNNYAKSGNIKNLYDLHVPYVLLNKITYACDSDKYKNDSKINLREPFVKLLRLNISTSTKNAASTENIHPHIPTINANFKNNNIVTRRGIKLQSPSVDNHNNQKNKILNNKRSGLKEEQVKKQVNSFIVNKVPYVKLIRMPVTKNTHTACGTLNNSSQNETRSKTNRRNSAKRVNFEEKKEMTRKVAPRSIKKKKNIDAMSEKRDTNKSAVIKSKTSNKIKKTDTNERNSTKRVLRKGKIKNYANLFISPEKSIVVEKHVPVYKKIIENPSAKTKDLYEFVDELKNKHKKRTSSDSDTDYEEYNKSTHLLLKQLTKIEKKTIKKKEQSKIKSDAIKKNKNVPIKNVKNNSKVKKTNLIKSDDNKCAIKNSTSNKKITNESRSENLCLNESQTKDLNTPADASRFSDDDLVDNISIDIPQSPNGTDITFNVPSSPKESDKRINIISDISIQASKTPKRTSEISENQVTTPWRIDLPCYKRNPHLLLIKNSSLPYMNQEMVLNSTITENFESYNSKTPKYDDTTDKNFVQSSILSYIGKNDTNIKNICSPNRSVLFDCHEFSPIKIENISRQSNILGNILNKHKRSSRVKRNLLQSTPLQTTSTEDVITSNSGKESKNDGKVSKSIEEDKENQNFDTSFEQNDTKNKNNFNLDNYFGFDDSKEENKRIILKRIKKQDGVIGKPTRISLNTVKNIVRPPNNIDQQDSESDGEINIEPTTESVFEQTTETISEQTAEVVFEPKLFEDLEVSFPKPPAKIYKRKYPKRHVRVLSPEPESDLDEEVGTKPKKKCLRTKAEDKEVEAWAKNFNKMCEEIDHYNLEVE